MKLTTPALCSFALVALAVAAVGCGSTPAAPEREQQAVAPPPPPPPPVNVREGASPTAEGEDCELQDAAAGTTAASCAVWEPCIWTGPGFQTCGSQGWYHCGDYHYCYTLMCPRGGSAWWREGC